jgi:hypothetical protein
LRLTPTNRERDWAPSCSKWPSVGQMLPGMSTARQQWTYLEATNERNADAGRHGFEVVEVKTWPVPVFEEPHKLIIMARKPAAAHLS